MSGKEVLAAARDFVRRKRSIGADERATQLLAALDDCVVLTREEAKFVRRSLDPWLPEVRALAIQAALALLTPTKEDA